MTRLPGAAATVVLAVSLAACQSTTPSSTARSVAASASPTQRAPATTPTAAATPSSAVATSLVVEKTGAALGPAGFMVFALIANPSAQTASRIAVSVDAKDAAGRLLGRNSGRILRIEPGQKQAIGLGVSVPSSATPASFDAAVTGVTWAPPDAGELVQVVDAAFSTDPKFPTVRVRLTNRATTAERATVTAVCFDDAGDIRGGGTRTVAVGASTPGVDFWIAVTLPVTPATCEAFDTTT